MGKVGKEAKHEICKLSIVLNTVARNWERSRAVPTSKNPNS